MGAVSPSATSAKSTSRPAPPIFPSRFSIARASLPFRESAPPTDLADRTYNGTFSGFLRPNAATPNTGRTSDYGYLDQNQIQGNNLLYNAFGGERVDVLRTTTADRAGWNEGRDWELSPYLKLSRLREFRNGWSAGPAFHFSFTNLDGRRAGSSTVLGREQRDTFDLSATDAYDITGLSLFQAPYTGGPDAVGPQVVAGPVRTPAESLRQTDLALWNDSISESLDVDLWSLSVGGEAVYQFDNRFITTVGAGIVFNMVDWKASRSDALFQSVNGTPPVAIGSSRARNSDQELLLGLYLHAAVGYRISPAWSIEANLRYDWSQSIDDTVGNSSFDVDLSGFSLGLGANYTFW